MQRLLVLLISAGLLAGLGCSKGEGGATNSPPAEAVLLYLMNAGTSTMTRALVDFDRGRIYPGGHLLNFYSILESHLDVALHPSGRFLYQLVAPDEIAIHAIDADTGLLSPSGSTMLPENIRNFTFYGTFGR